MAHAARPPDICLHRDAHGYPVGEQLQQRITSVRKKMMKKREKDVKRRHTCSMWCKVGILNIGAIEESRKQDDSQLMCSFCCCPALKQKRQKCGHLLHILISLPVIVEHLCMIMNARLRTWTSNAYPRSFGYKYAFGQSLNGKQYVSSHRSKSLLPTHDRYLERVIYNKTKHTSV